MAAKASRVRAGVKTGVHTVKAGLKRGASTARVGLKNLFLRFQSPEYTSLSNPNTPNTELGTGDLLAKTQPCQLFPCVLVPKADFEQDVYF